MSQQPEGENGGSKLRFQPHRQGEIKPVTGFVLKRTVMTPRPPRPNLPAAFDPDDEAAFKALNMGTAQPHQQRRVLEWLTFASWTGGSPYIEGDTHASHFAMGMQYVMQQVWTMCRQRPGEGSNKENG
jgi:hypothetical protein